MSSVPTTDQATGAAEGALSSLSPPSTILILSGGLDSAVLLWLLRSKGHNLHCLSFDYGQRHRKELSAAQELCELTTTPYNEVQLPIYLFKGSSQTSTEVPVPLGHYAEESMKATIVPNRNMVMLSIATAFAISQKANYVAYAAHSGDHAIYPDCREQFIRQLGITISLCDWNPPRLMAPFTRLTKQQVVEEGHKLGVPFELTYSCYQGRPKHCGKCGTCFERREAFALASIADPTQYE